MRFDAPLRACARLMTYDGDCWFITVGPWWQGSHSCRAHASPLHLHYRVVADRPLTSQRQCPECSLSLCKFSSRCNRFSAKFTTGRSLCFCRISLTYDARATNDHCLGLAGCSFSQVPTWVSKHVKRSYVRTQTNKTVSKSYKWGS